MSASPALDASARLKLQAWFGPSFPISSFSFSHGLEWACEAGETCDEDSLFDWLEALIGMGSLKTDAALAARAYDLAAEPAASERSTPARASGSQPPEAGGALVDLIDLAYALQPSRERRLEATMQGGAFLKAVVTGWPECAPRDLEPEWRARLTLPVAAGLCAAGAALPRDDFLAAYLAGFCGNLVSATLRLAPVGQSAGLRVLARLERPLSKLAMTLAHNAAPDLGSCAFRADLASLHHETQTTRLFRS